MYKKIVQHYIDTELSFGSLVGQFEQSQLPFDLFCSQLNTVKKKNSDVCITVVDCTHLDQGITALIDAHLHLGNYWKLSLPTSQTIIRLIQETRERYYGQKVLIFKLYFQIWYCWFVLEPVSVVCFAVRW